MTSCLDPNPPATAAIVPTTEQIQQRYAQLLEQLAALGSPEPTPRESEPPHHPASAATRNPARLNKLRPAALHGLAGQVVRMLAPHSEAPPVALLLQFLAAFGNALGPGPHCQVDATRHGLNLFVVLVGESSKSRKGTSWNQIAQLFAEVDRPWLTHRVTNARLTAAVLTQVLRDQPGGADRRHLVLSEEFASVLHYMGSSRGQLSPLLRSAWDHGHLTTLADPYIACSRAHVSLIAHITERELAATLHRTEAHNGFANRCLWARVRRSQCLPEGGSLSAHDLTALAARVRGALDWAHRNSPFHLSRSEAARKLWQKYYVDLSQTRPGLYGTATSRAEAQVLRLSALYAALDASLFIEPQHLHAALALWDYCALSASQLFGLATGDSIADRILAALNDHPTGLSRSRINTLFHGHLSIERLDAALGHLEELGIIYPSTVPGNGRQTTLWQSLQHSEGPQDEVIDAQPDANQPNYDQPTEEQLRQEGA